MVRNRCAIVSIFTHSLFIYLLAIISISTVCNWGLVKCQNMLLHRNQRSFMLMLRWNLTYFICVLFFQPLIMVRFVWLGNMVISLAILLPMVTFTKSKCFVMWHWVLQLHLMCGPLLGLNSPKATRFPLNFQPWQWPELVFQKLSYPSLSQPPSFSTPYLWWIDCHDRL